MAIQNEPTRISTPFADAGTKNVIPETMAQPSATAAASWQAGFPTVCSLPLSAGGIPPARNDFNGLFNQITQTERFLQDGGIFAWDASTDYGANRLVLGSDGNLYWSAAQSGPNTGAGAVDPTTDSGTYWGSLPMKTPGLGDSSNKLATTDWVRGLAVAPVYVNPAGSDANDGFSAATAVATLSKAVEICSSIAHNTCKIFVAGGSYNENLSISRLNCEIELTGNVSISGGVSFIENAFVSITGSSYSLTISGGLRVYSSSTLYCTVASVSVGSDFVVAFNCYASISSAITVLSASATYSIRVGYCSFASFSGVVTVNNSPSYSGIMVSQCSVVNISAANLNMTNSLNGVVVEHSSYATLGNISMANSASLDGGISVLYGSVASISGSNTVYGKNPIVAAQGSVITFGSDVDLTIDSNAGAGFLIFRNSNVRIADLAVITISCTGTGSSAVEISDSSSCAVIGSGNFVTHGTYSIATVTCKYNSVFDFSADRSVNISSNPPVAKKFYVDTGSQINVHGAGVNRFSGTQAGTVDSSSFGFYG